MENDKNRSNTRVAVYLIGFRGNNILLGKRINTSHMNNYWSLPAGHVYESESIVDAIIRESNEELGILITPMQLIAIGSLYQRTNSFDYINFIFKVDLSACTVFNNESTKCESLKFFDVYDLPNPMDQYIKFIIHRSFYAKYPWIDVLGF